MCFEDEDDQYADKLFDYFTEHKAIVQEIWPLEVCNSLLTAVKRSRLVKAEANHFFRLISALPIDVAESGSTLENYETLFELAGAYGLSSYDASYLALAIAQGLSLATLDRQLISAAAKCGTSVFGR